MSKNMGEIISEKRQNKRLTQEELASRLGVTAQAISKWERGLGLPDAGMLAGICKTLEISADVLLGLRNVERIVENEDVKMLDVIKRCMFAEPLVLEFGIELVPTIMEGLKTDLLNRKRVELVQRTGMLLPVMRVLDNTALQAKEIRLLSYDKVLLQYEVEEVNADTFSQILEQVTEVCRNRYDEIINKQIVKIMVDNLKVQFPGVADGLIPERISYLQVVRRLQEIIREKKNIRDFVHIIEEMEESL